MKWIKSLSAKLGGSRRRLDDLDHSSDSKSSRRSLKRKASSPGSITEQSVSSLEGAPADADAKWRIENILVNGPPSQEEWWGEQQQADGEQDDMAIQSSDSETNQLFHNCGYDAWEQGRAEWRKYTVTVRPPRPPPVRYDQVARGIRGGSRQFELPGRMRLSDLVDVYTDVWECDSDPW